MALPRTPLLAVGAVIALALPLAGCLTGERPNFDDDGSSMPSTGDENIDAVLQRLDSVPVREFTAEYDVITRLGGIDSVAVVVQTGDGRRSITINDIRFLAGAGTDSTCNLTTAECEASVNDARVSDVLLTHSFYAESFAARLRTDANRRVDATTGYTQTVAGRSATCVDIPLSGIEKTYCALDDGPLARYQGNDLTIVVTAFSDVPDEDAFETP